MNNFIQVERGEMKRGWTEWFMRCGTCGQMVSNIAPYKRDAKHYFVHTLDWRYMRGKWRCRKCK